MGCIIWLVEQAVSGGGDGRNYWWVAPVATQADIAYTRMLRYLPKGSFTANRTLKTVVLFNGAVIWFKGADRPDTLYGEDVHAAVIDEASRVKETAWEAVRSTLVATRGRLRLIGNVKGKRNWFYRLARRAEHGHPDMGYHKITAHHAVAAGVLVAEEIESAKSEMSEHAFRELFLAEPSDDEGNPFGIPAIRGCVSAISGGVPLVWGWDLGKSVDWTVGIGLDAHGHTCRLERWQHVPWPESMERIKRATGRVPALVDSTGLGDPVLEMLQKTPGAHFEGFKFTAGSKQQLMEGLAVAIQGKAISYPEGAVVLELENFEYEYTRTGVRYCLGPMTPVLTKDLRWVAVGSLKVGDELLAFDEFAPAEKKTRTWRPATVTAAAEIVRPCYRVLLDDGTDMIASAEHRWLTDLGKAGQQWLTTAQLRAPHPSSTSKRFAPHRLIKLLDVWSAPTSYEAGYLAAAFDGEGSLSQLPKAHPGHSARLTFAQRDNAMMAEVRSMLAALGFEWSEQAGRSVLSLGLTGRRHELLRFLGQVRPKRLMALFDPWKLGTLDRKQDVRPVAIEFVGNRPVIALGTTSKTLIAAGIASHNSAPEGFHDDCVCALALAVQHRAQARQPLQISDKLLARSAQRH